jgi:hypothetical protein
MTIKKNLDCIKRIVSMEDGTVAVAINDKAQAINLLKKNPRAVKVDGEDDEVILVYSIDDIDFFKAIRKA